MILAIVGPTASGKTGLAIEVAEAIGGEIVSVDSAQVFRGLDIGTAKPSRAELARVPHHLIDVIGPNEQWTAAAYAEAADRAIAEIRGRRKRPILCGGTGLWFRALVRGIFEAEPIDPVIRAEVRGMIAAEGAASAHRALAALDPKSAGRLHPNDAQRVGRALEYVRSTGRSIHDRIDEHAFKAARHEVKAVLPEIEKGELNRRIEARTRAMYEAGLVEETRRAIAVGADPEGPGLKIIGYRDAVEVVRGGLEEDAAIERTIVDTRRYAKRQRNWFRSEAGVEWIAGLDLRAVLDRM